MTLNRKRTAACAAACFITLLLSLSAYRPTSDIAAPKPDVAETRQPQLSKFAALCTETVLSGNEQDELSSVLREAANHHAVDAALLAAMMISESGCKKDARSHAGALGLMQLMPSTAKWLGVSDPMSVRESVNGGAKYLALLLEKFDGNLELALAAYNAGPATIRRYRRIPPYRETRMYIKRVMVYYQALRESAQTDELSA